MALNAGMMEFIQRYQGLRAYQDSTDQLLTDLLLYSQQCETAARTESEAIIGRLHSAELDLEDAKKSRRELQLENQQLKERLAYYQGNGQHVSIGQRISERDIEAVLQNHNPYVLVLIDGDGSLFKEHLVKRGVEGGRKAAQALKAAIRKQCHGPATEIEVIARVYVNLTGLAQAMRRDGSLESESQLRDFTLGFTQGTPSFDFIDVGGLGHTDIKIQDTTTWHLKNYNCKHVILGISHDAGYAPFVNELMRDETTMGRVTVLEGIPAVRELAATGINIVNLSDTLFRSERLAVQSSPLTTPLPPPVTSSRSAATTTDSRPASTPAVAPPSYAKAIKSASPPPRMTLPIPLQPKAANTARQGAHVSKPQPSSWNPGVRGLDCPLNVSQAALDNVKKRKDKDKLCNNHYLRGPCSKGDECCFEHDYKPSKEEKVAIAYLARLNPCTSGQHCEVDNCIYGHHCPTVRDGRCTHSNCKFLPEQHPPGTVLRKKTSNSHDDY